MKKKKKKRRLLEWVCEEKKKKKKHMGIDFSNPENQTHKHMILIIHTNTNPQTCSSTQ